MRGTAFRAGAGKAAGESAGVLLEAHDEAGVDGWLAFGVAAGGFGAGFAGLADAQDVIQQPVGILRSCVLGDEQQDAPVGCFEGGQQPPRRVEIEPADGRQRSRLSGRRPLRNRGGVCPRRPGPARLWVCPGVRRSRRGEPGRNGRDCQLASCVLSSPSSRRARSRSSSDGAYSSASSPARNWRRASDSWPLA